MQYCPMVSEVGPGASELDIYLIVTLIEVDVN